MTNALSRVGGSARWPAALAGLCALWIAGCGGPKAPTGTVEGKVLLNDAPYEDAAVVFYSPKTGPVGTADIQPGGAFKIDKPVPVGKYTVYLAPKTAAAAEGSDPPKPVTMDKTVPEKYWNEATSDAAVEVNEGKNAVTVKLSK